MSNEDDGRLLDDLSEETASLPRKKVCSVLEMSVTSLEMSVPLLLSSARDMI
jgi:hypothetical protein